MQKGAEFGLDMTAYATQPVGRRILLTSTAGGMLFAAACGRKEQASEWQQFHSAEYPYEIDIPVSWQYRQIQQGIDTFVGPKVKNTPTVITAYSFKPHFATLDQEVAGIIAIGERIRGRGSVKTLARPTDIQPQTVNRVGAYPAYHLETPIPASQTTGPAVERSLVFFADQNVWYTNLIVEPSALATTLPTFEHMLTTFKTVPTRRG